MQFRNCKCPLLDYAEDCARKWTTRYKENGWYHFTIC